MIIQELLKHTVFGMGEPDGAYSFENVLNSGMLLEISKDPIATKPVDAGFKKVRDRDAYWMEKGTDYLVPLICLYEALLHRCGLDTNPDTYPEIEFHPGLAEPVRGLTEHEYRRLVYDMELIYKLQVRVTQYFYHRQVALIPEERCKELIQEIEKIDFKEY